MVLAKAEPTGSALDGMTGNAFVRKMSGFAALSDHDMAAMAALSAHPRAASARVELVRQGAVPTGVVLEGFACRYRYSADGRRQIIALLLPGDLCDLDCTLIARMDHAIGTLTACRVASVAPEALVTLIAEHGQVALALRLAKLAEEANLRDRVVSLGSGRAPERLAHLLCEILVRLQAVGLALQDSCDLPFTQVDLADATGLSAVHVNRSLQSLRAAGLIRLTAKKLQVIDLPGLRGLCEFTSPQTRSMASRRPSSVQPVAFGAA